MCWYKYHFVQNLATKGESESILERKLYSFKSTKTNQTYHVIIDRCTHNVYVIKYYLKNHRNSKRKYNILTNLNEPRSVIYTCLNILIQEVHYKDNTASFGFVASNSENEDYKNTKRFRVYERFVSTFIGSETFEHYKYIEYSAYVLIPKIAVEKDPNLDSKIFSLFREHDFCEEIE